MDRLVINITSLIAIVCSIGLLLMEPLSLWFFILYLTCGCCYILRCCYNRQLADNTKAGKLLAPTAKYLFVVAILAIFIPLIPLTYWQLYWLVGILLIRISALLTGYLRYHHLVFGNTYSNTAKRVAFFCFPLLYWSLGFTTAICVFCATATISAIEDLLLNSTIKELDPSIKSYFCGRKKTKSN